MADRKISALSDLAASAIAKLTDYVPIVDVSEGADADKNKRAFVASLTSWKLADSWTHSGDIASKAFIDLAGYGEIMIFQRLVTLGVSGRVQYQFSSDNGSTHYTASGDYQITAATGAETAATAIVPISTAATAARSGIASVIAWNLAVQKPYFQGRSDFFAGSFTQTVALNAILATPSAGGNLTGGSIFIFGR